ncbi:MAG: hypothetical protein KF780_11015 [Sphingomonas sp.]|nr:hypothetical protein [Sphingomonas sp.]
MTPSAALDQAWRASHYAAVHCTLTRFLDSDARHLPAGTDGAIGRAQLHFAREGDRAALGRLEAISIAVFRLRQSLLARTEAEFRAAERELAGLARDWFLEAPMFPAEAVTVRRAA